MKKYLQLNTALKHESLSLPLNVISCIKVIAGCYPPHSTFPSLQSGRYPEQRQCGCLFPRRVAEPLYLLCHQQQCHHSSQETAGRGVFRREDGWVIVRVGRIASAMLSTMGRMYTVPRQSLAELTFDVLRAALQDYGMLMSYTCT